MRNVEAGVDFSYREDTYLDREPEADEEYFRAAGDLSWSFARWYKLFCRYIFIDRSSEIPGDNYEDHQFLVGVSAEKDLYQW